MDDQHEANQSSDQNLLQPLVTRRDLDGTWIGLAAAVDWIAIRGQAATIEKYHEREDEAAAALVEKLADMPPEIAEALVQGVRTDEPGPFVSVPGGIWGQTATSDASELDKPYRLILVDEDFGWEGAILGTHVVSGYRRLQIRTDFVRDSWPEDTLEIAPKVGRPAFAMAELQRLVEKIVASAPTDMGPLTQREMQSIVKLLMPGVPRNAVRKAYAAIVSTLKRGPRGPRNPRRDEQIKELGRDLLAAQLHN